LFNEIQDRQITPSSEVSCSTLIEAPTIKQCLRGAIAVITGRKVSSAYARFVITHDFFDVSSLVLYVVIAPKMRTTKNPINLVFAHPIRKP